MPSARVRARSSCVKCGAARKSVNSAIGWKARSRTTPVGSPPRVDVDLDERRGARACLCGFRPRRARRNWRKREAGAAATSSPRRSGSGSDGASRRGRGRARVGRRPSSNIASDQRYSGGSPSGMVTIHSPAGRARRAGKVIDDLADRLAAGEGRQSDFRPSRSRCAWPSVRPGITVRPPSSITRVFGPAERRTSASAPTSAMRPPRTASALAFREPGARVSTLPPVRTRSAGAFTGGVYSALIPASLTMRAYFAKSSFRISPKAPRRRRRGLAVRVGDALRDVLVGKRDAGTPGSACRVPGAAARPAP